jgi:uncharacterized protein
MTGMLLGAVAAGVLGGPHCVGMCGGFAAAAGGSAEALAWASGRLFSYAALGALAGAMGHALPASSPAVAILSVVLLAFFSLRLAGLAPVGQGRLHRISAPLVAAATGLLRRRGAFARFGFGVLNGLLPCGLVYAALALPVAGGSAAWGALLMVAFGLGTIPGLAVAATGLRRLVGAHPGWRPLVAVLVFVAGTGAVLTRAAPTPDGAPACHDPTPAEVSP